MVEPTKNCICCGLGQVSAEEGSYDICPICGWEDDDIQNDDPDFNTGANDLSLNQYRKRFQELRKKNPNYTWEDSVATNNFGKSIPNE